MATPRQAGSAQQGNKLELKMKTEINAMSATIAITAPFVQLPKHRNFGRRAGSTPLSPRPLSTAERLRLRALRERELRAWLAADNSTPASNPDQAKSSLTGVFQAVAMREQKREFILLTILAAAALGAVAAAFMDSAQFVHRWSEFVQGIRSLLT
jgi:hypothetical protein